MKEEKQTTALQHSKAQVYNGVHIGTDTAFTVLYINTREVLNLIIVTQDES